MCSRARRSSPTSPSRGARRPTGTRTRRAIARSSSSRREERRWRISTWARWSNAGPWIDRAAAAAAENPTPLQARRLETWRGLARACAGDAEGMRAHLERAVELAMETGQSAARCEALSTLAVAASRLGAERDDDELLDVAERTGREAMELCGALPGHPPWVARAAAALARVALVRGRTEEAADLAGSAMESLRSAMHEDLELDVLLPAAAVFEATGALEWDDVRQYLQMSPRDDRPTHPGRGRARPLVPRAGRPGDDTARRTDPVVRGRGCRWGRRRRRRVGLGRSSGASCRGRPTPRSRRTSDLEEEVVARRLGELFARVGASSRAEATAFAFRERVL